jgi:Rrf2 family transcriptional regulator, cysteine metabolism repressor
MRISAKAEYACVAMLELAANFRAAQPVRVKAIAELHGIPQRFLVQILLQLKSAGLVLSLRGALGGYQLARSPEAISLAHVINAIDREPAVRTTLLPLNDTRAVNAIRRVWHNIQAEEQRMLEELTLTELVRRTQQTGALSYQI